MGNIVFGLALAFGVGLFGNMMFEQFLGEQTGTNVFVVLVIVMAGYKIVCHLFEAGLDELKKKVKEENGTDDI